MYNSSQFLKYAKEFLGLKVKQEAIEEIKEIEINQRKYAGSSLLLLSNKVEEAVIEWLALNPEVKSIENSIHDGVGFVLTQTDGTTTGIGVNYGSNSFRPVNIRRTIEYLTLPRIGDFNRLLLILVCKSMEDAAQTLVMLREVTEVPPNLTIMVGFMDRNNFRSFGTFLE